MDLDLQIAQVPIIITRKYLIPKDSLNVTLIVIVMDKGNAIEILIVRVEQDYHHLSCLQLWIILL